MMWAGFLLICFGECFLAWMVIADPYFARHYNHRAMSLTTVLLVHCYPGLLIVPFVWLPFIIAYQRRPNPPRRILLLQFASYCITAVFLFAVIIGAGPPIQP